MKPIRKLAFTAILFFGSIGSLVSCGTNLSSVDKSISIVIEESSFFTATQTSFVVDKGSDILIHLTFVDDYTYDSCNYDEASFDSSTSVLTLNHVVYPQKLEIIARKKGFVATFDLNGGSFLASNENQTETSFTVDYVTGRHARFNTPMGVDRIRRDGYLLVGWMDKNDSSHTLIGLGSKFSHSGEEETYFEAVWKKWTDISDFDYESVDGSITLTGYHGSTSIEELVLPNYIDNLPVTRINTGFISSLQATALYLPETLTHIENNAFSNLEVENIYLFDGFKKIMDNSFSSYRFKTWHLNACHAPKNVGVTEHCQFSDDMDHLILNQQNKKMIFFGGCSMSYGLNSQAMANEFKDYTILDCGVIGGTNAYVQFEIMTDFLSDGDVFVHAPEVCSSYQLMEDLSAETRMFTLVEPDFDLLSRVDMTKVSNAFDKFNSYLWASYYLEDSSYDRVLQDYNEYGDICINRPSDYQDIKRSDVDYGYDLSLLTQESLTNLVTAYDKIKEKGATVYFSFSPTNENGLSQEQQDSQAWLTFESFYKTNLPKHGYSVISDVKDYLLKGRYFYDEDYHLNDDGVRVRTDRLKKDIKAALL